MGETMGELDRRAGLVFADFGFIEILVDSGGWPVGVERWPTCDGGGEIRSY